MERRAIAVHGAVQGVGFRPFVYGLARDLDLHGFVRNQGGAVQIEVEGDADRLDAFLDRLSKQPPPLARIEGVAWEPRGVCGEGGFRILGSCGESGAAIAIVPDVATCEQCLAELFDPADRRYRYPFLNCTNCGPRLTIVTGAPYDRQRTTMAGFAMCPACRAEYEDPGNRRFHAQPTACPVCGPRLGLLGAEGAAISCADPLKRAAVAIRAGQIVAIKGLGGYHLACDAQREDVVGELRRRKHRDGKPFAVMVADVRQAGVLCELGSIEREMLASVRRPIVLLRRRRPAGATMVVAPAVAPGNPYLGVMLAYAPIHHLLLQALDGAPLVMTSGNRADEPIAYEDDDAVARLAGVADLFVVHNRPIHVRCDDSVTRVVAGQEMPIRRSRGYAPQAIALPLACPRPILAVGGQLKGAFALGWDRRAVLSHHLGDLDHLEAYEAFMRDVRLYQGLFGVEPTCLAHDLHPDYATTRWALGEVATMDTAPPGIRRVAVQHHHAHLASCMAEHGLDEPVIGVTFDGSGAGTDGTVWGGEFLVGDYRGFERAAHLRCVGMPGGEQAVRQPWRMALSHLADAGVSDPALERRVGPGPWRAVHTMLERRFNTPMTSSAGRLFDAVATLLGVRDQTSYEGQAAVELEWLAMNGAEDGAYPFELGEGPERAPAVEELDGSAGRTTHLGALAGQPISIDTRPLIRAIVADTCAGRDRAGIGRRFHNTLVEIIAAVCGRIRELTDLNAVALTGGVFMNALLTVAAERRLLVSGFRVFRHRLVPTNDGGLCLGQLAVAAARLDGSAKDESSQRESAQGGSRQKG